MFQTLQLTAVCPIIECNYSLKMIDSYGDGWQTTSGGDGGEGLTIDILGFKK